MGSKVFRGWAHRVKCILAPVGSNMSSYSFFFSPSTVKEAAKAGIATIRLEQICAKPKKGGQDDDGDDGDDGGDEGDHAHTEADRGMTQYNEDDRKEEDFKIWSTSGLTPFIGAAPHRVSLGVVRVPIELMR